MRVNLSPAGRAGVNVKLNEEVLRFSEDCKMCAVVETNKGKSSADKLALTVKPWVPLSIDEEVRENFESRGRLGIGLISSEGLRGFRNGRNFPSDLGSSTRAEHEDVLSVAMEKMAASKVASE